MLRLAVLLLLDDICWCLVLGLRGRLPFGELPSFAFCRAARALRAERTRAPSFAPRISAAFFGTADFLAATRDVCSQLSRPRADHAIPSPNRLRYLRPTGCASK